MQHVMMDRLILPTRQRIARIWAGVSWRIAAELLLILVVGYVYSGATLLNGDASLLQQTGEHNESATLPILAEIGLSRYHEIPLWNPYMLTGFPHAGDFINHFWQPVSTLSILVWGGINGMKVSIFLSFLIAGVGQWLFARTFGLRGAIRLWVSIMFMISGGVALLWRLGWYELLLGIAWFPWCYASVWWALHRRDRASLVLTVVCVAMVLTAGGGYYPFYLFGTMAVLVAVALIAAPAGERLIMLRRALVIAVLGASLLAVMVLPLIDGYRSTGREAAPDLEQLGSQPISYALVNYLVSVPEWFDTNILGNKGGWNWFYIGALPIVALALIPLALRQRAQRTTLIAILVLSVFVLAWHANRSTPMRYVYDWLPFLYMLRFPGRLLIVATCPLLVLAGLGLQHFFDSARSLSHAWWVAIVSQDAGAPPTKVSLRWIADAILIIVLVVSARDVFTTNKGMAFNPGTIDPKSFAALKWLKNYDPSLYYTNIGGGSIIWGWTPAAYLLEMPIVNFKYNRQLTTYDPQHESGSPFFAKPKYMLASPDQPRPADAQLLHDFEGLGLWYLPDALPFAFSVPKTLVESRTPLTPKDVVPLQVRIDGPNRVVLIGEAPAGSQLVALQSNYPGWSLLVDGKPAPLVPANEYLGADMPPGKHDYAFVFSPAKYTIGLWISSLTLLVLVGMLLADAPLYLVRDALARWVPRRTSTQVEDEPGASFAQPEAIDDDNAAPFPQSDAADDDGMALAPPRNTADAES